MSGLVTERIRGPEASAGGPAAVLLHGFTQNRHCWGEFADELASTHSVWAVDLPGHGDSRFDEATFEEAATLTAGAVADIGAPVDLLIGYSMGGRIALRAALDYAGVVRRLVVIGATAGISDADNRADRIANDRHMADRLRNSSPREFLDFWLDLPLFAGVPEAQQHRAERLGGWGSGVAESLLYRGPGSMEPIWDRLHRLEVPTLVIAGDNDTKFTELGHRLVHGIGANATFASVHGVGHACHLEAPDRTAEAIRSWTG